MSGVICSACKIGGLGEVVCRSKAAKTSSLEWLAMWAVRWRVGTLPRHTRHWFMSDVVTERLAAVASILKFFYAQFVTKPESSLGLSLTTSNCEVEDGGRILGKHGELLDSSFTPNGNVRAKLAKQAFYSACLKDITVVGMAFNENKLVYLLKPPFDGIYFGESAHSK